jgi:hypothetical protein
MAAGAPLQLKKLKFRRNLSKVKPFLRKELQLLKQGTWTNGTDGDLETPLIDNKDCAM